jgi:shikimate 5-dehydrogenase
VRTHALLRLADAGKQLPARGTAVALLLGAGGTAKAGAYALQEMGVGTVLIANRTVARAESLAQEFGPTYTAVSRAPCPPTSFHPAHPTYTHSVAAPAVPEAS